MSVPKCSRRVKEPKTWREWLAQDPEAVKDYLQQCLDEIKSPDPQPEGSPVGAGSSVGPEPIEDERWQRVIDAMKSYSANYYRREGQK